MEVNGKEIKFLRTVRINFEIAKMCPGGSLANFSDLFEGSDEESSRNMIKFIVLMNRGYEEKLNHEDPTHEINAVTEEELEWMDFAEMNDLFVEATRAFLNIKQTVEVAPSKSKKKTSETLG